MGDTAVVHTSEPDWAIYQPLTKEELEKVDPEVIILKAADIEEKEVNREKDVQMTFVKDEGDNIPDPVDTPQAFQAFLMKHQAEFFPAMKNWEHYENFMRLPISMEGKRHVLASVLKEKETGRRAKTRRD